MKKIKSAKILAFVFALIMALNILATPLLAVAEATINDRIKQLIVYYKNIRKKPKPILNAFWMK